MTRSRATFALVVSLSAAWCAPVCAQTEDPQRLYMRGAAAYGDGRFEEAAALFEQAYALRPDAPLLYNLGLAREQQGDVARAIDAYERFLAAAPEATERTEVERSLVTLRRQRALEEEIAREPGSTVVPPVAPPTEPPVEAAPWIIAGVGAATLIAGAITAGVAQADYDNARVTLEHLRATQLERSANDLATVANVLFVAGSIVLAGGLVWGVIDLSTRGQRTEVRAGLGTISIRGTF